MGAWHMCILKFMNMRSHYGNHNLQDETHLRLHGQNHFVLEQCKLDITIQTFITSPSAAGANSSQDHNVICIGCGNLAWQPSVPIHTPQKAFKGKSLEIKLIPEFELLIDISQSMCLLVHINARDHGTGCGSWL